MKEFVLRGIFEGVHTLKSVAVLDVPDQVISKVARTITAAEKMGIRLGE